MSWSKICPGTKEEWQFCKKGIYPRQCSVPLVLKVLINYKCNKTQKPLKDMDWGIVVHNRLNDICKSNQRHSKNLKRCMRWGLFGNGFRIEFQTEDFCPMRICDHKKKCNFDIVSVICYQVNLKYQPLWFMRKCTNLQVNILHLCN